ncbi:hypothetical protein N7563_22160 [Leclercia adecarboxylata ATCC 23216 = NBRC 102595]|nr:hypothetical protein [Leclercia adecarboxylata ATCC 23216 = NBRC 102595]
MTNAIIPAAPFTYAVEYDLMFSGVPIPKALYLVTGWCIDADRQSEPALAQVGIYTSKDRVEDDDEARCISSYYTDTLRYKLEYACYRVSKPVSEISNLSVFILRTSNGYLDSMESAAIGQLESIARAAKSR